MRVTMIDRWLLMLCLLAAVASEKASAACDNKCREVKWMNEKDPTTRVVTCYDYKDGHCWGCWMGACDTTELPGKDICQDNGKVDCSQASDCTEVCTIVGFYGQAGPGVTKNKYNSVTRKTCQP